MVMGMLVGKKTGTMAALVLAAAAIIPAVGTASAAPVAIELCAVPGTVNLPGAAGVPIWGFGAPTTPGDCTTATAGLPGPALSANEGDTVTITVHNGLAAGHTISFEIPGVTFNPGPSDAAAGATVTRSFTASAAGTYVYQSSGDFGRQEAMGLYGALVVRSLTAGQAYDVATSAYDVEATLVLSQIDPAFNASPDTYDMYTYRATYWLINGAAYPGTAPILATTGQRVLLRYVNAGRDNTSMQLLGMHQQVLARDAQLLNNPFSAATEIVPAGATEDAIAVLPASTPPSANGFALFNRNLHVTNGSPSSAQPAGGMLTFIQKWTAGVADHLTCAFSPTTIVNDGASTSTGTVTVGDFLGNPVATGSYSVSFSGTSTATTQLTPSPQITSGGTAAFTVQSVATAIGTDTYTPSITPSTSPTLPLLAPNGTCQVAAAP